MKTNEQYDQELFDKEVDAIRVGDYAGALVPIEHSCIEGHSWTAAPNDVLRKKHKCPHCGKLTNSDTTLYHIMFKSGDRTLYKLGITNRPVKVRYAGQWRENSMELLWSIDYPSVYLARSHEQLLLHRNLPHLVKDSNLKAGNTEVLSCPVSEPQPIG